MDYKDLRLIQDKIGYSFQNEDLLEQAFVRRSYSKEEGGEHNEVLEFIGDKVLDFIVVKLLVEKYGSMTSDYDGFDGVEDFDEFISEYPESDLTEIKKMLVEKKMLANRIDILDFSNFLIMGQGDIKQHAERSPSVKADLFEAIIGAVAVDCNWNITDLQSLVDLMLEPEAYLPDDNEEKTDWNYVQQFQEWYSREHGEAPRYIYFENNLGYVNIATDWISERYVCQLPLGQSIAPKRSANEWRTCAPLIKGWGNSKSEARMDFCTKACRWLDEHDLLFTIRDEIDNPNKEDAISQLEILARRGYFSIPAYEFNQMHDRNGNPIWNCDCGIREKPQVFHARSSSKKEAKKKAAFMMLQYILENA